MSMANINGQPAYITCGCVYCTVYPQSMDALFEEAYVTFPVSQADVLEARKDEHANVDTIKVKLRFSDGSLYNQVGEINFVDVTVDRSTDSVTLRATIPNPKGTLIDNQLVRVILESG